MKEKYIRVFINHHKTWREQRNKHAIRKLKEDGKEIKIAHNRLWSGEEEFRQLTANREGKSAEPARELFWNI